MFVGMNAVADREQAGIRPVQYHRQILLGDGAIIGPNHLPPALDRLLHLGFIFLAFDQGINQLVDLRLDCPVRDGNLLVHAPPFDAIGATEWPAASLTKHYVLYDKNSEFLEGSEILLWKSVAGLFIPVTSYNTGLTIQLTSRIIVAMSSSRVRESRKTLVSVVLALISFGLGILVETLERQQSVTGLTFWLDNIAAAFLLGLVVFFYERGRERELVKKLQIIELMNHHVRNALQPIMYVPYSQDQQEQLTAIQDAVRRIDWALREILPGEPEQAVPAQRESAA